MNETLCKFMYELDGLNAEHYMENTAHKLKDLCSRENISFEESTAQVIHEMYFFIHVKQEDINERFAPFLTAEEIESIIRREVHKDAIDKLWASKTRYELFYDDVPISSSEDF